MPRRRRPPRAGALSDLAPLKIVRRIILLQTTYYLGATVLIVFMALVAGQTFTVDLIFNWRNLRGDTTRGWMLALVWMLDGLVGVISLLLLVARSKLVPDFAFTIHFIHLMITSVYSGSVPTNLLWWALQVTSSALMISVGIWSCRWRELQPIAFGGRSQAGKVPSSSCRAISASRDEEVAREDGMGPGRDEQYEMMGMKKEEEGIA